MTTTIKRARGHAVISDFMIRRVKEIHKRMEMIQSSARLSKEYLEGDDVGEELRLAVEKLEEAWRTIRIAEESLQTILEESHHTINLEKRRLAYAGK